MDCKEVQNEICRFAFSKLVEAVDDDDDGRLRLMFESLPPNFLADFSTLVMKFSRNAIVSLFLDELRLREELLSRDEFKLLSERLNDEHDCDRSSELLLRRS